MTDLEALALTIWGEARGEPIEGKIGVAMVVRNRFKTAYRGAKSYTDVCTAHAQFSAWTEEAKQMQDEQELLEGDPLLLHHTDPVIRLCVEIAKATMLGVLGDATGGANHYMTRNLYEQSTPTWAKGQRPLCQLGAHVFFNFA